MEIFKNILVIRTDRMGDLILTLPLISQLKDHFPQAKITMLVHSYTASLAMNHPDLFQVLILDGKSDDHLLKEIKSSKFDCAILVHPTFHLAYLIWRAKIPVRVGTGYRAYSFFFNRRVFEHRRSGKLHEVEFNLNLLISLGIRPNYDSIRFGIQLTQKDRKFADDFLSSNQIRSKDPLVVIHPGTGGSSRNWRPERMAELALKLIREYRAKVIITGGSREGELVKKVNENMENLGMVLSDQYNLNQFAAIYQKANLVIANSTGPLHLAVAVGTFVLTFYPNIPHLSAQRWGPYTQNKKVFTPHLDSICTRCQRKETIYCECMDSITVDEVFNWIRQAGGPKFPVIQKNTPNQVSITG